MTTYRDPLEDDVPVPTGGCGECEHGWRQVKPAYAHHEALKAGDEGSGAYAQRYASAINTVYPCRVCTPGKFFRWANGHFDPEHERDDCEECARRPRRGKTHRPSYSSSPPAPTDEDERPAVPDMPERKDLE